MGIRTGESIGRQNREGIDTNSKTKPALMLKDGKSVHWGGGSYRGDVPWVKVERARL